MKSKTGCFVLLLCVVNCWLGTHAMNTLNSEQRAFVILGQSSSENLLERHTRSVESSISSMHVTSVVMSRFARVTIATEMVNEYNESKEMTFSVRLPEAAFITEFEMVVSGVTFVGVVKEKKLAEEQYKLASERGNSAGLVSSDVRETQTFNVAANVPAQSSVTFNLVYQELLKRKLGAYDHVIMVNPRQIVDDLSVEVYITEKTGIASISTILPRSGDGPRGKVEKNYMENGEIAIAGEIRRSKYQAKITFQPTATQQRLLLMIPEDERKVTVRYDVTREKLGGEIQTRNGYFVHFFAPEDLPIMPKKVVFIIDRSGSMIGRKIEQTKTAFESVLKELREVDEFNIVTFAGDVTAWKSSSGMVPVTEGNVRDAIDYVNAINAGGSTNFNDAMLKGADFLKSVKSTDKTSSMIIILTDGQPTEGETRTPAIRLNVKKAVGGRYSVFCLGFGANLNHNFLKRLAYENDGIARQIYEDSDADIQLEGFFQEVATPLLLHVKMSYLGANVTDLSRSDFDKYFGGCEVIVVGAMEDKDKSFKSVITGTSAEGDVKYQAKSVPIDDTFQHWFKDTGDFDDFIERMWAYFTIRELLEKKAVSDSRIEMQTLINRITSLALKYKFVTPLTSMVVTLPEDEITTTTVKPTVEPPYPTIRPPPCFRRGQPLPLHYILPPIWCPYILEDGDIYNQVTQRRQSSSYSGGRSYSRSRSFVPSLPQQLKPPQYSFGLSSFGFGGAVNQRMLSMPFDFFMYTTTKPPIARPPHCNKKLIASTGRVESTEATQETICEWDVILPDASWIDLNVQNLNSTQNQLVITSEGKNLLNHYGGTAPSRYISVQHNQVKIRMTLYPDDVSLPGFVISYSEFIPTKDGAEDYEFDVYNLDEQLANCGRNINSSESRKGFISSPGYPKPYHSNAYCVWTFLNEDIENLHLEIKLKDIDIETDGNSKCSHDKVIVMAGFQNDILCGYDAKIRKWKVNERVTKVVFLSDDKLEASGFKIQYKFK